MSVERVPRCERHNSGGGPWMSESHSVIEEDLAYALPSAVAAQLRDLGLACNNASQLFGQAVLAEEQAADALEATPEEDPATLFRRLVADEHTDARLTFAEQCLATYTVAAASYAAFATTVLAAAVAGTLHGVEAVKPVLPSVLLADPDGLLPAVDLPSGRVDDVLAERVRRSRQRVTAAASNARASGVAGCYDGQSAVAARPDDAVELDTDVPSGLHAYAALLLEVLQLLVTDPRA
ncbi:hypothetical protein [Dactylosporangium darangshiense]|uniref:Uncharacterized protein n=1 Tax=Dactylosporangium darangshiense TaxID=579108 RepID=A0ABP8DMK8_9ACTN